MIGYGFLGGHKVTSLPREPLPHISTLRARLQSERTRNGVVPPLPSEAEALAHYTKRPSRHRVTVPVPRNDQCRPASQVPQSSPPVVAVLAGSSSDADVRQAARLHVGVHRPFSGQTLDCHAPRARHAGYTAPTVRGLSGETPEHPISTPQPAVGNNTGTDRRQILPPANCEVAVSREGLAGNARAWQPAIVSGCPMRSARAGLRDDRRSNFNLPSVGGMSDPERAGGRQSLPRIPQPAWDDESGWDEYMRRAFAGGIEAF